MMMVSPMSIPIFRKILSVLFTAGSLRTTEILAKMPEEAESSFYNAMKKLENEGLITATVKLKKLAVYSLTEKGMSVVKEYFENSMPSDIISAISQNDNYEDLLYEALVVDVKRRTGIEAGDEVYKELVKKNYELFLKKMREDLEVLKRD
jgi:DNA-binding PadR family transcriptional regulator